MVRLLPDVNPIISTVWPVAGLDPA